MEQNVNLTTNNEGIFRDFIGPNNNEQSAIFLSVQITGPFPGPEKSLMHPLYPSFCSNTDTVLNIHRGYLREHMLAVGTQERLAGGPL